ncbi:AMP-binding protein [Pseudomonas sp. N040]|uniref:AMP-binding protein n=1 Tax=Pseudomonas sp. N040 TaxID=2785325 RepID=UPI0018A300EC|nr:AMP-binding protein [Pseudomonas sp. N040]MBF7729379.1 AMP-binding protein [Pseudomonas sp. N040]MBW7013019.1 AMP-binding protein [Pseudomonas sp. N040]
MSPVLEQFFDALQQYSGRPALVEANTSLDYAGLLAQIGARVQRLHQAGARRLGLALDNGIDWVLWDLAALRAGVVCVPLPGFFSPDQQQHVLDSAGVDSLIATEPALYKQWGFNESLPGIFQRLPARVPDLPEGTLKITYTSGTTGQPKGVCLDADIQLRVARSLWQASLPCRVEKHLCVLPLATLLENIAGVYAPLMAGACIELAPMAQIGLRGASQFDLPSFLGSLNRVQPNSLILLPQLLLALVTAAERGLPLPQSLRFIAVGGGRVAPQLLARAEALGLPVYEGYGLSECASVVCLNAPGKRQPGSVGQPLQHVAVQLAADGEVLVKGARMLGYVGEPALTGEWLATGDLGHFEGDFLVLHGRKKHQFITAFGRNVNPEWVESELVQQLPIAQTWLHGEALPANVAVVVARFAATTDAEIAGAIVEVNQRLPDYARVHHWLRAAEPFSAANGLATANGRLRRAALAEHYQSAIEQCLAAEVV